MNFIFECLQTGEFYYVNAPDLFHAIKTFRAHHVHSEGLEFHIYVRID